jgi:hypothetical protein
MRLISLGLIYALVAIILQYGNTSNDIQAYLQRRDQRDVAAAVRRLSSGLTISLTSGPASATIEKWIRELEVSSGSVKHADATNREQMVVSLVNAGTWDVNAYHDYQRFAAGTGTFLACAAIPCS